jgi:hypothetical protein
MSNSQIKMASWRKVSGIGLPTVANLQADCQSAFASEARV